jgi:hypothetical protein
LPFSQKSGLTVWLSGSGGVSETPNQLCIFWQNAPARAAEPLSAEADVGRFLPKTILLLFYFMLYG